ncbi:unnamed protein product [Mytilus coruscus]|uniref:Uncharacterized protein n=1 Tax=Mytilus coruscus TaxID=42192 RepID=A0A6J8BYN7_MYTCO|nr:unnamed protein product [Mytilus coruscus]
MNKRRPIWSESTVNLYSLLLNYGGPVAVDLMRRNLGGPSLSRVYLQARQTIPIETSLTETSFRNAAEFYKKVCKDVDIKSIIFTIAVDATPVLPLVRAKGNKLLGFATNKDIIVQSAEDVIQVFKDVSLPRAQQTYVFALVPLRSDIPYCILAAPPVVKGENQGTALNWLIKSKEWGQQYNLNIYCLGADGDSKIGLGYLHLGQILNEIYFNKELSIRKRIKFSWTLVQFCRLWKTCIVLSKYKTDKTFISDQTYNDVIIAGHSFILMTKLHFLHHKNQPFEPWTWGSNSCEDIFPKSRCLSEQKTIFVMQNF